MADAVREWDVPVYGTWVSRPAGHPEAEWDTAADTPGRITVRPGLEYKFLFGAVADVTNADVEAVAAVMSRIPTVRQVDIQGCARVTDKSFARFAGMTQLNELSLVGCYGLSANALKTVATLTGLRELSLEGFERLTDRSLALLASLTRLERLSLHHAPVTDAGLAHLPNVPALQTLILDGCRAVTDRGIDHVAAIPDLRVLGLYACWQITGRGLKRLATIPHLEWVGLPPPGPLKWRIVGRIARWIKEPLDGQSPPALYGPGAVRRLRAARPDLTIDHPIEW